MKKLGTLLIAFALVVICCVFLLPTEAWAATEYTEGYYTYTVTDGEATITAVNTTISGDITVPSTLGGYSVTMIGNYAFAENQSITDVDIPNGVTTIGEGAFFCCENLTDVTIPDSVTMIGDYAFDLSYNLTNVYITDLAAWCQIAFGYAANPLQYGGNLYIDGVLATDVIIPDGVTAISDMAFVGCQMTSITILGSVTTIGNYVFSGCTNLNSITFSDGLTHIGEGAFVECTSLTSFEIPDSLTTISNGLLNACTGLTSVIIPKSITTIEEWAFSFCENLETVYYRGSEANWNCIYIGEENDSLFNANIIYDFSGCSHTWDAGVITNQPTCGENGQKTYTCSSCGSTKTEPLPKTNVHSYNGVVTRNATCKKTGVKTYTCTTCGDSFTEVIAKLTTHSYADGTCTVCGDSDPDYVAPTEPTDPTDPTEPGVDDPTEPVEPDNDKEEGGFFAAIAAFFEAIFRVLFFFLYL